MWPKALAQLIELLPHATRLLPMADKFFATRSRNDEETQQAIIALRNDLAHSRTTHEALYRQLNEQAERISDVVTDTRATRAAAEAAIARIETLEKKVAAQSLLLIVITIASLLLVALVIALLLRH